MTCIIFFTFSIGATTEIWIYVMSFLLYTKHYTRIYNIIPVFAFFFHPFYFTLAVSIFSARPQSCWLVPRARVRDAGPIIFDVPQRWECDILHERTINETSFKLPVHICLRFTLWCICHFESIWFNLISVPGHPTILCAFSVTIAYGVQPTDSSANEGV